MSEQLEIRNELNSLVLDGTVVKAPALERKAGGAAVSRFIIAHKYRVNDSTNLVMHFLIEARGRLAEACAGFHGVDKSGCDTGTLVHIVGSLFQDADMMMVCIRADHIEELKRKGEQK